MRSVNIMYRLFSYSTAAIIVLVSFTKVSAQVNSPYSRYGLGDYYNSRNVANRGMGGLSAATFDYRSVNFLNPLTSKDFK